MLQGRYFIDLSLLDYIYIYNTIYICIYNTIVFSDDIVSNGYQK